MGNLDSKRGLVDNQTQTQVQNKYNMQIQMIRPETKELQIMGLWDGIMQLQFDKFGGFFI